jgi:hypothetical protein
MMKLLAFTGVILVFTVSALAQQPSRWQFTNRDTGCVIHLDDNGYPTCAKNAQTKPDSKIAIEKVNEETYRFYVPGRQGSSTCYIGFWNRQFSCSADPKQWKTQATAWFDGDKAPNAKQLIHQQTGCYLAAPAVGTFELRCLAPQKSTNDFWRISPAK